MNIAVGSEITCRTIAAAKMFFPPLVLVLVFPVLLVLVSLANPVFVRIGGYQFPILIPYFENVARIGCYVAICVAFLSLFVSVTFRNQAIRLFRRMELERIAPDAARLPSTTPRQEAENRLLLREDIRLKWQLAQVERRLRDLERDQQFSEAKRRPGDLQKDQRGDPEDEPVTDFEIWEILIPVLWAIILLTLLMWPIVLIVIFVVVMILAVRGTLKLALTRLVEFVFRVVFKDAFRL